MCAASSEVLIFGRQLKEERDYWVERLQGERAPVSLPVDHPRPAGRPARDATVAVDLPDDLFRSLSRLTGNGPFLLYTTLCATLQVCLARYAGSSTIVVGSPARRLEGSSPASNALAIRGEIREQEPFSRLLQDVRQALLDAYARQSYPFHRLLADLGYGAEARQCPLFGVALALRDIHGELPEVGHDVDIRFALGADHLSGEIDFDPALFERATVERFARHYLNVLRSALADPRTPVGDLAMLDETDRALLAGWSRGPDLAAPRRSVHQLIAAQAERTPDAPAVLYGNDRLSFRDLDSAADRLAHHLRQVGATAESRVAIVLHSSPQAMVAILAALKSGAAYVPLDPNHPQDRLATILSDVRPAALITTSNLLPNLPEHKTPVVLVDRDREAIVGQSPPSPAADCDDTAIAYVIYTSGSTGMPNGVMISHRALVSRAFDMRQIFDLDPQTRQLQFASLTFDMSCEEILATWMFGGAVVLLTPQQRQSGLGILAECDRLGVTKMNMAASVWHNLVDEAVAAGRGVPGSLRISVAGAESPSLEKLRTWNGLARHPLRFFNIYGPTEATIMATFFEVALGTGDLGDLSRLPIGRPLPDTRLHVLDPQLRPVPIGVPGELHLGGIALARGYLNRPDVTARKFIPDPWSEAAGARLYKTGDLVRHNASGLVEFLGRVDFQVKIRGFRIELEEIEASLRQHQRVRRAVVLTREDTPGDKRLVAYVVPSGGSALDVEELRQWLSGKLPEHMVPRVFVELAEIPLLPSGKIDRQALPAPDRAGHDRPPFVVPRTATEEWLAEVWADLLMVDRIGATDNFFQLGGHSLLVMQLVSRIDETFDIELAMQQVFDLPNLAELAAQIEAARTTGSAAPPLAPVSRGHRLPLSFAQQRLWFIDQIEPGNPFYNVPSAIRLTGHLDVLALTKSLHAIVKRHEALRTTFVAEDGRPWQRIQPELILPLPVMDVSGLPEGRREAQVRGLLAEAARHSFDLQRGPLLQAILIHIAGDDHVFAVTAHHVACDAWSIGIFNHELSEIYQATLEGRQPRLPELPLQYADFAHWQRQGQTGARVAQQVAYWRERLRGAKFDLDLPTDRPRPAVPSFSGAFHLLSLSPALTAAIGHLSRERGMTIFVPLLTAFVALLHRYSGQEDLVVGSLSAGRNHTQIEHLIGFFVNTMILRVEIDGDPGFPALLDQVREVTLGALSHQDLPFERVVEELNVARDLSQQPLFQVMFALQNAAVEPLDLPGLALRPARMQTSSARFDLTLTLTESEGRLIGGVEHSTELFDAATIDRFASHLTRLLAGMTRDPECRISDLPLLSAAERQQLVEDWNDTRVELPQTSIHACFAAQAARTPTAAAVIATEETLSYAELNTRANRLAHGLLRLGIGGEDRVGICLERSAAMVVAELAVLKAGGAYVPLDPGYPRERLDFMLDDAGISALVLAPGSPLSSGAIPSLTVDSGGHLQGVRGEPALPATDPPTIAGLAGLDSLAYVMYTSGSTGLPKGVEVPHAGVLRLLWRSDYATLDGRQTLLQAAPMSFDASTFEVWGALLFGGRCVLMPHKIPTGESLRAVIGRHGVDTLFLTTALFNAVVDEGPEALRGVDQLLFGGEAVSLPHVRRYRQELPHTALVHCYGPTESTTFTCFQPVPSALGAATSLPIGRPIVNTRMYVLDRHLELVGLGIVGELYIGGRGLARGYLRRPSLTADHFLPDPFSHQAGARLYRTGDLVRWRFPNAVEFVGRRDQQVKVRGHRIELPEIEIRLRSHPAVADAVVLVREDQPGQKVLVAYLTAKGGTAPATDELLAFLLAKLPDYMVPRTFVTLPAMPLTTSGKIDRQALRAAEPTLDAAGAYTAPATPTEETVAGIWSIVLDRERISRNDDFFALGGHSLLATQVVLRLRQAFSIELPIHTLFENPQLSSFALCVEQAAAEAVQSPETVLERVPRDGDLPLSFAQRRLWFLDQLEPGSPVYTIPAAVRLAGRLDTESLARSLDEIVRRHEVLRTRFPAVGGEPVQRIVPEASFPLERVDLTPLPEDRRDAVAMQRAETAARQPFDLATGPLLRGLLLQLRDEDHVLVVAMSHVVADGWSIGVLTRELGALYDAFSRGLPSPLPELPIQYADFAHWQRQRLNGEVLEEQLLYWRERLRGAPERLDLPSDRPRPPLPSFAGASELFSWAPELSAALHRLGADQDATAFMTLLAAFQILLYRQSGQADLSVGTPVANRTLVESEALIGFFVNTLVLRVQLDDQPTFRQLLRRVREVALSAYAHQDVPFEMVVEALRPQRATGSSPLFQVLFNFGNTPGEDLRLPGLTLHLLDTELGTSKRDLTLSATDTGERLQGALTYSSDLFDPATIRRLVEQLETLLASVVAHPEARVSELEILSEAARHQLLWGWNDTAPEPPPEAGGVHVLFERQADRTPANLALVGEGGQLTFAELETRANQLAHLLRRRGVGPEVLVALYLERSQETVVALLAVLKAGGAYLPLDPGEPRQSLAFILGDARPQLLVTRATLSAGLPAECPGTVLLDTDGPAIARESGARPSSRTVPDHLLYVIYTSGSTGRPKGVLIAHRQMLNYVACLNRRLDLPPGTGYAMVSTFAADLGCTMLYPALTSGGCLHVLPQNRAADPVAFAEYLERHTIDALKIVPSHLAALLASSRPEAVLPRRLLVLGGEASRWEWIEKIEALAPRCVVLNHYGPTETTVGVMALRLTRAAGRRGPVPLGQPLAGTQVYVLDRHLRPVPFGVAGQIHVGGVALGRGYLDRPDLTAERFIPDPFRRTPGGRLYTTGDLARHLPDDTLEFLGRADHQIKLRGFRIELGEIESVLRAHPGVREAVVALREEAEGDRRLVAYLVSGSTGEPAPTASELRALLRERLPEHMVPAAFVALPELPLTPNGKVDRRALPAPEGTPAAPDQARVPPRDVLELQLVQTWQDLLGVQPIGIHDNFFDLGGHSLLMVTLIARLRSTFGKVPPLAALLQQPTVAELAALLRRKGGAAEGALVRMQPRGTRKPFFCVHPAGGTVLSYLELARQMGPEQPFYALQSNGGENGHGVEELARRYLAEVLAAQPEGPYSLGGHSFGGVVAYEMARQLEAQGRTVALLALFDAAPASPDERSLRDQDGRLMASFALHLGLPVDEELLAAPELAELTADEQLSEVLRRAKQAGLVPSDMRHDEAHHLLTLLKSHVAARLRYVPQPYPGRVTLFRAQEQLLAAAAVDGQPDLAPAVQSIVRQVADPAMGWGELAAGGVEVNELPGTHYSMLRPPHVTTLADRLKTCLERSSRPEG